MTALAADTNRAYRGQIETVTVKLAAVEVFKHGIAAVTTATGYACAASDTTGITVIGVFEKGVDNSAGAAGDLSVDIKCAYSYAFACTGADQSWVGKEMYVVDDNTVGLVGDVTNDIKVGTCMEYTSSTLVNVVVPGLKR